MKKYFVFLVFISMLSVTSFSQDLRNILDTIQIQCRPNIDVKMKYCLSLEEKNGKYGWLNVLGEWIIPPVYTKNPDNVNAHFFKSERNWNEGIWIANKNGLFGAINYKNEIVIPFIYKNPISDCKDGIIVVQNNQGKFAYFNKYGKQLTKFQIKPLPEFNGGIASLEVSSQGIKDNYIPNISTFYIVNNQIDTLFKFKNVKFKVKLEKKNYNIKSLAIFPNLFHADNGLSLGYFGLINRKKQFFTDINYKIDEEYLLEFGSFSKDFHSNRLLIKDKKLYVDTLGNTIVPYKISPDNIKLYDYNDFNVGSIQYIDNQDYNYKQVLINQDGDELYVAEKQNNIGINGSQYLVAPNTIIPVYEGKNKRQLFYSNDFKFLFSFSNSDANYKYQAEVCYPLKLATDSILLILFRKTSGQEFYLGDKQIVSTSGKPLSNWIPRKIEVFPLSGNLIYNEKERSKLLNFSKEIIFECPNCYIKPFRNLKNNLQNFNEIGLFEVELLPETPMQNGNNNVASKNKIYVNYKGMSLSALCTKFKGDFYFIDYQINNFNPEPPIKFDFNETYLINSFNNLYKF